MDNLTTTLQFSRDGRIYQDLSLQHHESDRRGWLSADIFPGAPPPPDRMRAGSVTVTVAGEDGYRVFYGVVGQQYVALGKREERPLSDPLVVAFRSFVAHDPEAIKAAEERRIRRERELAARPKPEPRPKTISDAMKKGCAAIQRAETLREFTERCFKETVERHAIPKERSDEAVAAIIETSGVLATLVGRDDRQGVENHLRLFERRLIELTTPAAIVNQVRRCVHEFIGAGWNGGEIDLVERLLTRGEKISNITETSVQLGNRVLSRKQIRLAGKPATWEREDTWIAQFGPLPE